MEQYHSITKKIVSRPIYAFDKLDGSNLRVEWTRKNGFCKWGTKTQMMDETNPEFGAGIGLFRAKYERDLHDIFKKERYEKTTAFFEYWSPNSFAGFHAPEPHNVTLFDIKVYKKGYLLPKDFLKLVGHLDVAKLLYHGNPNEDFVKSVQDSTLPGMTLEGVVCKGQEYVTPGMPLMFKVKALAWLNRLKIKCGADETLYERLC